MVQMQLKGTLKLIFGKPVLEIPFLIVTLCVSNNIKIDIQVLQDQFLLMPAFIFWNISSKRKVNLFRKLS